MEINSAIIFSKDEESALTQLVEFGMNPSRAEGPAIQNDLLKSIYKKLDKKQIEHAMEPILITEEWEVMHNGCNELFIKYRGDRGDVSIRLTPNSLGGFHISDWNTPGKFKLLGGIDIIREESE